MIIEGEVFLVLENEIPYLVWSYVSDQVNIANNKIISIRLEAILAALNFLEIPKFMARDIVYKINMISKYLHDGIRIDGKKPDESKIKRVEIIQTKLN